MPFELSSFESGKTVCGLDGGNSLSFKVAIKMTLIKCISTFYRNVKLPLCVARSFFFQLIMRVLPILDEGGRSFGNLASSSSGR